jgi:hypothetical protein
MKLLESQNLWLCRTKLLPNQNLCPCWRTLLLKAKMKNLD